jgi:tetratricopeptide (TPR) repeat protein
MRRPCSILLFLLLPCAALSQPVKHGDEIVEIIGADEVNVRDMKGIEGEVIAKVRRGEKLKRLGNEEGWFHVLLPDGREGWVNGHLARPDVARATLVVTSSAIKLRRNPSMGAPEVTRAMQGDELKFLEERNNWYFVLTPDGQKAWVPKEFVAFRPRGGEAAPGGAEAQAVQTPPEEAAKKPDLFQDGLDLLKVGNPDRALEVFQALLREVPNHGGAHYEAGRILKGKGRTQEALDHFQKALTGEPRHPEAQFHIEELQRGKNPSRVGPKDSWTISSLLADETIAQLILWGGGLAAILFLMILLWVYRRRRKALAGGGGTGPQKREKGFEATLRAAVEKRPLMRVIEEAEKRQEETEEQIRKRFEAFGGVSVEAGASLELPEAEPVQALLKKVEEIRQVVVEQEERARMYTDLIRLQSGKIEALNEEIEALKRLLQMKSEGEARREKPRTTKQKV